MTGNLRWRDGRSIFCPPKETFQSKGYDVEPLPDESLSKPFVVKHHYSHSYPAARFRFGLFSRGELVGVAVFSHPCSDRVLTNVFGGSPTDSVELGRFVLLDEVPFNGETWFLARGLRHLKQHGIRGVVSFSDPTERTTQDGHTIFPGHIGTIYQAANAAYLGRGTARTVRLLPDGTIFNARAIQKIRQREQGWEYASGRLVAFGASRLSREGDSHSWLLRWLGLLTRPLRHPGNHRYAWALHGLRLGSTDPYPRRIQLGNSKPQRAGEDPMP